MSHLYAMLVLSRGHEGTETKLNMLGSPDVDAKRYTEIHIPASVRLPITMGVTVSNPPIESRCLVGLSFDPVPGAQYEVVFRYQDNRCGARLFRLTQSEGQPVLRSPEVSAKAFRYDPGMRMCGVQY